MNKIIPFLKEYLPDLNVNGPDIEKQLSTYINDLILYDFQKLLFVLYRLDISEQKLQMLLDEQTDQTAGEIIAIMIIEREQQKIESRKKFKATDNPSNEERW